MLKYRALLAFSVFALACGSKSEDDDGGGSNASGASGGTAGTGIIPIGGSSGSTGSGGSGGSGTSGTSGELPPETADSLRDKACAGWNREPELLPTVLELVVDTSLSMRENARGSNQNKWEVTRDALRNALDALPATTSVGVLYYPGMDTEAGNPEDEPRDIRECVNVDEIIPIGLLDDAGSGQRGLIEGSLDDAGPAGSTPTHDAFRYAYENGMAPFRGGGNRFMLLITDGQPTFGLECTGSGLPNDPAPTQPIIEEVFRVRNEGVRSFLIGSPGSESGREWMSEAAILGGTARSGCSVNGPDYCHIDLTQESDFSAALNAALARILGQIVSCSFELPSPPSGQELNLSQINVIYSPGGGAAEELVGRDDSPTCSDGWQLDSSDRVVLCPATCEKVQSNPQGRIELLFGCDSTVIDDVK
ncbi:MAG TPA: vWA domain-containing protein [Polyangiaceae bacterium]